MKQEGLIKDLETRLEQQKTAKDSMQSKGDAKDDAKVEVSRNTLHNSLGRKLSSKNFTMCSSISDILVSSPRAPEMDQSNA